MSFEGLTRKDVLYVAWVSGLALLFMGALLLLFSPNEFSVIVDVCVAVVGALMFVLCGCMYRKEVIA